MAIYGVDNASFRAASHRQAYSALAAVASAAATPRRRRSQNTSTSLAVFRKSSSSHSSSSSFSASALSDDESPSPASTRALRKPPRLGATVGLLGAGAMGEALARGLLAAGALDAGGLCASVRTEERRRALTALLGASRVFGDALDGGARSVAESSDVIVVGVKPDAVGEVLDALRPHLDVSRHLIVSIAAGVTLDAMARRLPEGARIARVMPNTPTLVGAGASVFCLNEAAAASPGGGDSATVRATMSTPPPVA